jgi:hypothetical protein
MAERRRSIGARATISVGLIIFCWSFFLPATNVLERGRTPLGTPLTGWEAFVSCFYVLHPLVFVAEPRTFFFLAAPLMNAAMLIAPLIAIVEYGSGYIAGAVLTLLAIIPLFIPSSFVGDLFVGFYSWLGSFLIVGVGCILVGVLEPRLNRQP